MVLTGGRGSEEEVCYSMSSARPGDPEGVHHSRSSTRILEEVRHSRSSSRRDYNAVLDVLGALDVLDVLEAAVLEEVVALPVAPPSQDPMAFLGYGTRYLVALPRKGLDACLTCTEPKDCQTQRELEFPDAPRSCEAPRSCQVLHRLEVPRGREGSATAALEVLVLAMLVLEARLAVLDDAFACLGPRGSGSPPPKAASC